MNRTESALLKYLEGKSSKYAGKYLEVREVISGWLSYVPQTFPHYTRHTVEHSDQIVSQLSHLLFPRIWSLARMGRYWFR
jgi:molecular chaperone HtpG